MFRTFRNMLILFCAGSFPLYAAVGATTVCKWKDDKAAAFTLGADDGCASQLDNMIPELTKRGFVATFYINPAAGHFLPRLTNWIQAVKAGNDFANHTLNHIDVDGVVAADSQIGGCARRIWAYNSAQGKFQLFMPGGGTKWINITDAQKIELLNKYKCYPLWDDAGRGDGIHDGAYIDHDAATLKGYLDNAIRDGDWHFTIFHGVGGDWIIQNVSAFTQLLDYMVTKKNTVWFPTCTQAHKYKTERKSAVVAVVEATDALIRLNLTSSADTALYNYPLTLKSSVPTAWDSCRVKQGTTSKAYVVTAGTVMFEALPGKGEISLTKNTATGIGPAIKGRAGTSPGRVRGLIFSVGKTSAGMHPRVYCAENGGAGTYALTGARITSIR